MKDIKLNENQFAVLKAEYKTGILLNNNGTRYRNDQDSLFHDTFDDFRIAKEFAILKVTNNPEIECIIVNSQNETIFYYDINGERKVK